MHHELPFLIIPFKRYSSEAVELTIAPSQEHENDYSCETSTAIRLKIWFFLLREYFKKALKSLAFIHSNNIETCKDLNSLINNLDNLSGVTGWLKKLVRYLVNSGRWVHTRFA